MNFSSALLHLKGGRKLTRAGWDGKDQWVVMQDGYPDGIAINRNTAKATGLPEGSVQKFEPYYTMFTAWGTFVPWVPSTGDLNAEDWEVYLTSAEREAREALHQAEAEVIVDGLTESHVILDPNSVTTDAFVKVITRLQDELDEANAKAAAYEDAAANYGTRKYPRLGATSNTEYTTSSHIRYFEDTPLPDKEAARFRLLAILLQPVIDRWRGDHKDTEPPVDTAHWVLTAAGSLPHGGFDLIHYLTLGVGRPRPTEFGAALEDILDLEATRQLIRPGDPNYPTRPQRLTEAMRLRQSFPQGTTQPLKITTVGDDVMRVTPVELPEEPIGAVARYFVTYRDHAEHEVSKEEYVSAERSSGFRSKFGPDEPATASWSSSMTGASGRIEYGKSEELPQQP